MGTISADGSPQVTIIWIGLEDGDLVSGHMSWYAKLYNIERDRGSCCPPMRRSARRLLERVRRAAGARRR
jgi:hypothetical protein